MALVGVVSLASALTLGCEKDKSGEPGASEPSAGAGDQGPSSAAQKAHDQAAKITKAADKLGEWEYEFETAKFVFAYEGFEVGTVTVWVADHGKTVVLQKDMTKPMPSKATTIWRDDKSTMWNEESKQVQIMSIRPRDTELRLVSTTDPKQFEMAGYEKKPNEAVAGKDCEVWSHPKTNVTLWRWKKVDLKYINGSVGKITQKMEATSVETGVTLPADLLKLPDGYPVQDMTRRRKKK